MSIDCGEVPAVGGYETILVVEHESAAREHTCRMLERGGYVVLKAPDGSEAISVLAHHEGPVALLLSEIALPGMPSPELIRWARGLAPKIRTLVIGDSWETSAMEGQLPRGTTLVRKPITLDDLSRKVREVLDADEL